MITVDAASAYNGHLGSGDVVPVFTYLGQTYGPFGDQSILAAGCAVAVEEPPAEEPPVEEPPAEEPPAEEPPAEEPPAEEPPAEEPPAEEPPAEEPPAEEPPAEEPPAEEPPAEVPPAEEPPAEEPPAEEPPAEEPPAEEPPAEEPPAEEPPAEEPPAEVPPAEEPGDGGALPDEQTPEPPAVEPADPKVTICQATASTQNPYVTITIDAAAAYNGHLGGDDIVPVFTYLGETYGPFGDQDILAAGCAVADEEPPVEEEPPAEPPVDIPDGGTSPDDQTPDPETPVDETPDPTTPVDETPDPTTPSTPVDTGTSDVEEGRMDEPASRSLDGLVGRAPVTTPVVTESAVAARTVTVKTLPNTGSTTGPLAIAALAAVALGAAMIRRSARV
ncbi:LPXTG cell wall anchor domain-containing protein [Georgenia muralis]